MSHLFTSPHLRSKENRRWVLNAGDRQLLDCGFDSPQILPKPYSFYTSFVSGGVSVGGSLGVAFHDRAAAFLERETGFAFPLLSRKTEKLALRDRCYSEFEQGHLDAAV